MSDHGYSPRKARDPEPGTSHYPFFLRLKEGGRVWRDDKLNDEHEWLDLQHPGIQGNAANICYFGYSDLSLDHDECPAEVDDRAWCDNPHPYWDYEEWQSEVRQGNICSGYNEWVESMLAQAHDDFSHGVLTEAEYNLQRRYPR